MTSAQFKPVLSNSGGPTAIFPFSFFPLTSFFSSPGSQFGAQAGLELTVFSSRPRLQVSYWAQCPVMSLNKLK